MKVLMILFVVGCGWPLGMMLEDLDFVQQCQRVKVDIHKLRIKRYVELIVLSVLLPFKIFSMAHPVRVSISKGINTKAASLPMVAI